VKILGRCVYEWIAVVMDCLEWVFCPFCHLSWLHQHSRVEWLQPSGCIGTRYSRQMPMAHHTGGFWCRFIHAVCTTNSAVHCLLLATDL